METLHLFKYEVVKNYDSTTAAVPQNGVQYKGAITELLVVKKESVINNHKHLFSAHESATVYRSTTGH